MQITGGKILTALDQKFTGLRRVIGYIVKGFVNHLRLIPNAKGNRIYRRRTPGYSSPAGPASGASSSTKSAIRSKPSAIASASKYRLRA